MLGIGLVLALALGAMDISRPDIKKKKMRRQWIAGGCAVLALAVIAFFCDAAEARRS